MAGSAAPRAGKKAGGAMFTPHILRLAWFMMGELGSSIDGAVAVAIDGDDGKDHMLVS